MLISTNFNPEILNPSSSTLERIFIENKIYQKIEDCETWNEVIDTIDKGLDTYKKDFYREIVKDDIVKLTEIKIKRISKFDKDKGLDKPKNHGIIFPARQFQKVSIQCMDCRKTFEISPSLIPLERDRYKCN